MSNVSNLGTASNAKRLLIAGFMAILAAGIGFAIRGGILDNWGSEFGFTASELGLIGGAGFTGFCFGIIIGGLVADKIGAKGCGWLPMFCQNSICRSLNTTKLPDSASTAWMRSGYCDALAKANPFHVVASYGSDTQKYWVPGCSTTKYPPTIVQVCAPNGNPVDVIAANNELTRLNV
jgi:hypothetical protein